MGNEIVRVYFKATERTLDGTDDDDMDVYHLYTIFDYADMDIVKVLEFMEDRSVSCGEDGGYFNVVAVVRKDRSIVPMHELEAISKEVNQV